ncbi:MAG TPA: gamma-glutamyl-gamma-aminobutyrate hydrolase family protein [Anaeromyxobacteraceae bacterium]|nr:gamma-glutamyl-gamma-aminobutyrate hydrolase family protein [Anaeromyxobacteraceae bacterium]
MEHREVVVLQHVACEGPGLLATSLRDEELEVRTVRLDRGEPVPSQLSPARGLVAMGGPMGVHESDRYPFLLRELSLIERALADGVPFLGICLGSQLLAAALGARVYPAGAQEIGILPVTKKPGACGDRLLGGAPAEFLALHWHGDVFDLPKGALSLARSERTEHQAFRHGERAYGLLFHLEANAEQVASMAETFAAELSEARVDRRALLEAAQASIPTMELLARRVFSEFATLIAKSP